MRGVLIAVVLGALIWLLLFTHTSQGAAPKARHLAPPVPCTSKNRLDVFIDEDWIMWECTCHILVSINICTWQVVGGVDKPSTRKLRSSRRFVIATPHA